MTHYIVRTRGEYYGYIYHVKAESADDARAILTRGGHLLKSEKVIDVQQLNLRHKADHVMFFELK